MNNRTIEKEVVMWKALRASSPAHVSLLSAALIACVASCSSPRQPVTPYGVAAPTGPVVIDSAIADWVAIPNAHENYDWTADGLLKYTFQLQNMTDDPIWIAYKTTFFDASGVTVVDEQGVKRRSLRPAETVSIPVVATNPAAKKVKVQILK